LLFSFIGISQTLPTTSYIKMIDVWMIFTMLFLFLEVSLHACKEVLRQQASNDFRGERL
jgi:hypothetical protein